MSEINASNFKKEHGDIAPDLVGVTELTSPYFFVPPSGTTEERPEDCEAGTLRFNTDHGTLEIFRGKTVGWEQIQRRDGQYVGGGTGSNTGTGTRGLMMGGSDAGDNERNEIEFLTISTLGNTQDFGDLTEGTRQGCGLSSSTRAIRVGGTSGSLTNVIDFVTIASIGNATDFGDMPEVRLGFPSALANEVRGVVCLGETSNPTGNIDDLDYVTIASTGNAVAFGEGYASGQQSTAGGSTTRGIYCGGKTPGFNNSIDFITIMTTGNGTDFGDLTTTFGGLPRGQSSNATRMLVYGGSNPSSDHVNSITFLTIATLGNSVDFGDISSAGGKAFCSAMCSKTRGVFAGGRVSPDDSSVNVIEFVEIATTGNTQDFGDMAQTTDGSYGASSGHGGL